MKICILLPELVVAEYLSSDRVMFHSKLNADKYKWLQEEWLPRANGITQFQEDNHLLLTMQNQLKIGLSGITISR